MIQKKIEAYVRKHHMLEQGDKVIAGISGGADSICLLFVLLELRKVIDFDIRAVHVNHGLRGEDARNDERYVQEICQRKEVPVEIFRKNVELIARNRKQSMEEAGRDVRREAFYETMHRFGGTKIALAHHQNDNAETFFLNLARGTGLRGAGGMRPVAGEMIRPLLCVERKEIESYLTDRGIGFCTDATNLEDDYARNRVRNHVIPYMEQNLNRKTVQHMNQLMEQMQKTADYMDAEAEKVWRQTVKQEADGGYTISDCLFEETPEILRTMVLKKTLIQASGRAKDIEAVHIGQLMKLYKKQCGREADLPYRIQAKRCYEGIRLLKKPEAPEPAEHNMEEIRLCFNREEARQTFGDTEISWSVFEKSPDSKIPCEKDYTKWFDYDIIKNGLTIRYRRPGDYITIDKNGNTQKLKSYFINEKIPQEKRGQILLAAQGSHILWIIGYRTGSCGQIGENTKRILEIRINGGEINGRESKSINTRGRSK